MRKLVTGLVAFGLVACAATVAGARCGDRPGDRAAVDSAVDAIITQCGCCWSQVIPRPRRTACPRGVVSQRVRDGTLPRRCAGTALRRARRICRASTESGLPCFTPITTTTTLPAPRCSADADCDDGNPCTADACSRGRCFHRCECFGPGGRLSCCPGPAAQCEGLRFWYTCGDPVCSIDPTPIPGVPPCTTEMVGQPCTRRGHECDPGAGCGVRLLCTDHDPAVVCPISRRAAKRDIDYLTPAEADRLRDQILRFPLAEYHYRNEAPGVPPRLGFIIDDVGPSPAVAPGGSTVDVYGYASMAVAAIQAQQREIARLGREVEALRRECRLQPPARRRPLTAAADRGAAGGHR